MKKFVLLMSMLAIANAAEAKPVFTGQNYSGVYNCKGSNSQVGDYEVTATLRLNRVSSYDKFGAYYYETATSNSVTYSGRAAAQGNQMAISYKIVDGHNVESNVGTAVIKKNVQGRWSFRNFYYEPDDNGGNYGSEYCVMNKAPVKAQRKPKAS